MIDDVARLSASRTVALASSISIRLLRGWRGNWAAMARRKSPATRRGGIAKASHVHRVPPHSRQAPTHVYTSPRGIRGEVLRIPQSVGQSSVAGTARTHVVFLPGNPGVIEVYRAFIVDLASRLPQDVRSGTALHALGYPGHDVRELNGNARFSIADHIEYVCAYLASAQVRPSPPQSEVVFVGHSYGAYLALRVLSRYPDLVRTARLIMLMPAVHRMADCRPPLVRVITDATAAAVLKPIVSAAGRAAPRALMRSILKAGGVTEPGAAAALSRLFDGARDAVYDNCLSLAREEARVIQHPSDEPSSAALGAKRSFLFWTDSDPWCTAEAVSAIRDAFGNLEIQHATEGEAVPHAFSVDMSHLGVVSRGVAAWVTSISRDTSLVTDIEM